MSGTKEGSVKALKKIYAKHGEDYFKKIGGNRASN